MKTYQPKHKDVKREQHMVDVEGKVLGRIASEIADMLTGKNKPTYSKHMDMGDFVTVKNAEKVKLTGNKLKQKVYRSHSGYPGGYKETKASQLLKEQPHKVVQRAVKGMLPKNRLQSDRMARLKFE